MCSRGYESSNTSPSSGCSQRQLGEGTDVPGVVRDYSGGKASHTMGVPPTAVRVRAGELATCHQLGNTRCSRLLKHQHETSGSSQFPKERLTSPKVTAIILRKNLFSFLMAIVILPGFNNGCQLRTPALGEKTRNKAPRQRFLYLLRVKTSSMVLGLFISPAAD